MSGKCSSQHFGESKFKKSEPPASRRRMHLVSRDFLRSNIPTSTTSRCVTVTEVDVAKADDTMEGKAALSLGHLSIKEAVAVQGGVRGGGGGVSYWFRLGFNTTNGDQLNI